MAIEMVRIPSETPNISNTDDFVGLRYAFGNQNGYVIGKGQECSYTINGSKFKINSGRLVLQGVECDVDASGVEITIDNVATKRYYTVYLQVNLALNETKILATFDTATYPNVDNGEDLTQNTTGVARIKLYQFDAINGVISNVQKIITQIDYTGTALVGYDIQKGTIEERLDALGFKQGVITLDSTRANWSSYVKENYLKRQGNYVIGHLKTDLTILNRNLFIDENDGTAIGIIPSDFIPKDNKSIVITNIGIQAIGLDTSNVELLGFNCQIIGQNVMLTITNLRTNTKTSRQITYSLPNFDIVFGYEAKPL